MNPHRHGVTGYNEMHLHSWIPLGKYMETAMKDNGQNEERLMGCSTKQPGHPHGESLAPFGRDYRGYSLLPPSHQT